MIYNSNYDIKLAQIAALGGDVSTKYDSEYSENLEILRLMQGGLGAKIDDANTSTGTVWSSSKTLEEIEAASAGSDIVHYTVGQTWTQHDNDEWNRLYTTYGLNDMFSHIFIKSDLSNMYFYCMSCTGGTMMYQECYGEQIVVTALNQNISVGETLSIMARYYYSKDDFFVLEEGVTATTAMSYKFGTLDVSTAMNTLYAKATFDGDTVYMRLVSIDTTLAPRKYTFAAIVGEFGQNLYQCEIQTITTGDPITFIHKCKIPFTKIDDANKWTTLTWSSYKINTQLGLKADKTYVDASLALKTDTSTFDSVVEDLQNSLMQKANESDVSARLATKVDSSALILDEEVLSEAVYRLNQKSSSAAQIDDVQIGISTVWSSNKTNVEIQNVSTAKQNVLVSGTNIKTIDYQSVLGSGNLVVGFNKELKTDADAASAILAESSYNLDKYKVESSTINHMIALSQAAYDALAVKDPSTLYVINA